MIRTPNSRRASTELAEVRTADAKSGLTLVEVLMSMLVTGIGLLGVIALLPLAFVRAVQATNLTNGTILRFNAESMIDYNPRLLLRWQPNQSYQLGDIVLVPNSPLVAFQCTTAGTAGLVTPTWNTTVGGTTTENPTTTAKPIWTTVQNPTQNPQLNPPPRLVIDPLGWNAMGTTLQGALGNNGAATPAVDPLAIARYNGEISSMAAASQQVTLPDSWVEQARGPVKTFTTTTATLTGSDLSGVGLPPASISRVVLLDASGKVGQTRLLTTPASATTVTWSSSDPIPATFTPVSARVETEEQRYTWMLTVIPSSGGGSSNVEVTVFFHRSLSPDDEKVFAASGADGVQTPFTVTYSGNKPFVKKGGFLFDCYFGRWYRIVNITNDTGSQLNVFVDQPRPQTDVLASQTFGAVFMRGVVDVFPLSLK